MEERLKAIKWWNSLTFEHKFYKVIEWLKSENRNTTERHPDHLTGREIEEVYNTDKFKQEIEKMEDNKIRGNTLDYWVKNANEDYMKTPISVLKYITILEELLLEKDKEIEKINKSADYWVKKHDEIILINSNLQAELSELKRNT